MIQILYEELSQKQKCPVKKCPLKSVLVWNCPAANGLMNNSENDSERYSQETNNCPFSLLRIFLEKELSRVRIVQWRFVHRKIVYIRIVHRIVHRRIVLMKAYVGPMKNFLVTNYPGKINSEKISLEANNCSGTKFTCEKCSQTKEFAWVKFCNECPEMNNVLTEKLNNFSKKKNFL